MVIPFERTIPPDRRDPKLGAKLEAELPSILTWAVRGAVAVHREGFPEEPPRFTLHTHRYRGEQDLLAEFLATVAEIVPGAQVAPELRARGCDVRPTGHDRRKHWHGIRLRTSADR